MAKHEKPAGADARSGPVQRVRRVRKAPASNVVATGVWSAALGLVVLGGCIIQNEPPPPPEPPPPTTVIVRNQTARFLEPSVFINETATTPEELFGGPHLFTAYIQTSSKLIGAGQSASFTAECVNLQSLGVRGARFFDGATLSVATSDDQVFLLRDRDLSCGDTVEFVYSVTDGVFHVAANVTPGS